MAAKGIIVRPYRIHDQEGLLKLWKKTYKEEEIKERAERFNIIVEGNPFAHETGNFTYLIVEDNNGIVIGYIGTMPVKFAINGQTRKGYFLHDSLVDPDLRGKGLGKHLMKEVTKNIDAFIIASWMNKVQYNLTKKSGWLDIPGFYAYKKILSVRKYLKATNSKVAKTVDSAFRGCCWVHEAVLFRGLRGYKLTNEQRFDNRVDVFANAISKNYGIVALREANYLNWKFTKIPSKNHSIYYVYKFDRFAGYFVLNWEKLKNGRNYGSIVDVLIEKYDVSTFKFIIRNTLEIFRRLGVDYVGCLIVQKQFVEVLKKYGFMKIKPHSPWMIARWENTFSREVILNADNWYLTYGDNDREFWRYSG